MPPNQVKSVATLDSLSGLKNVQGMMKRAPKRLGSSPSLGYRNPMHHSGTLGGLVRIDSSYWHEGTPTQASYWNWSAEEKEELIFHICKTEEVRDLFTANHFESNLRKDAERRMKERQAVINPGKEGAPEGYWDMPTTDEDIAEQEPPGVDSQKESYWEWSHGEKHADDKEALIEKILSEERIRQSMTVEHFEKNLIQESENLRRKEQASYWDEGAVAHGGGDDSYWQEAQ